MIHKAADGAIPHVFRKKTVFTVRKADIRELSQTEQLICQFIRIIEQKHLADTAEISAILAPPIFNPTIRQAPGHDRNIPHRKHLT